VRAGFVTAAAIFVMLAVSLEVARRRHRLSAALAAIVLAATALWVFAFVAIRTDYHDADGATDCWPSCTLLQEGVAVAILWVPAAVAALVIVGGLLSVVGRIRERRERAL
jgi:hypothetical protein